MTTSTSPVTPKGTGRISIPEAVQHSRISGVGAYRPERVVMNAEVIDKIDSSDEWIRERSGIISRHRAAPEQTVIDMSEIAARQALEQAGVAPEEIGFILLSTITHPYQTPAAAPELGQRLGSNAPSMDISAACAGYCYGIGVASDMVRSGSSDHVLVIGVEKLSDFTNWYDRGTAFIFGDGAGAAVVSKSDFAGIGPTIWGSEGDKRDTITQTVPWTELRAPVDEPLFNEDPTWPTITMQGQSVFRWAVWSMAPTAQKCIDAAGISIDDLDAFIPHQANMRIIDAMAKQLKLPADIPIARDIATTANTSAASIPIATTRMLAEGEAPSGGLALQIGFGAGLVYAGQVVVLP